MTDEEAIAAFYACNNAAFDEIYDRWFPRLALYFYHRGVSYDDVQDLAQDVLAKMVGTKGRPPNLSEPHSVERYLFTCAHNKLVDHWRSPRHKLVQVYDNIAEEGDASRSFLDTVLLAELKAFLSSLPTTQRQALELYLEGYSTEEIAQKMGVPIGTAGTRIKRARDRVKDAYRTNLDSIG